MTMPSWGAQCRIFPSNWTCSYWVGDGLRNGHGTTESQWPGSARIGRSMEPLPMAACGSVSGRSDNTLQTAGRPEAVIRGIAQSIVSSWHCTALIERYHRSLKNIVKLRNKRFYKRRLPFQPCFMPFPQISHVPSNSLYASLNWNLTTPQ